MFLSLDLSLALLKYDWQTKTIHLRHTANDYIHTSCIPGCLRLIMQLSISLNVRSSCLHILRFGNTSQTFVQLLGCRDWIYGFISAGKMPDAHYLQPTHYIFFIHSSVDRSLHCFHNFIIVNDAALSMRVRTAPGHFITFY